MSVELLTHVVGFTASVIAFVLWLPQAHRVWNLRHQPEALRGISLGTQSLVITNSLLWFGYGALEQAFWIAAPGFINLPLAAGTMVMVLRARRKTHPPECQLCHTEQWHRVFITTAAGAGSTISCTGELPYPGVVFTNEDQHRTLRATIMSH